MSARRCQDCGEPCSRNAARCRPCSNRRHRTAARGRPVPAGRKPRAGVPVLGLDGRRYKSMAELAAELNCSRPALYRYAEWAGDHWRMIDYPDPRNTARPRGGSYHRKR
jgi:hypothetical protein